MAVETVKLRVLLVTHRFPPAIGGVEVHAFEVARYLVSRGHEVTVLTSDVFSFPLRRLPKSHQEHVIDGIGVRRFFALPLGVQALTFSPSMIGALLDSDFDVVHAFGYTYPPGYVTAFARALRPFPFILSAIATPPNYSDSFTKKAYQPVGRLVLKQVNHLVVQTNREVDYFASMHFPPSRITKIYGTDISRFRAENTASMASEFRDRYQAFGKIVLFVGRVERDKGVIELVRSAPKVLESFPETKFLVVGPDYGARDEVQGLSTKLGISDKVVLTGGLFGSQLVSAFVAADVFVQPSYHEIISRAAVEALAAGKPIVASDIGALREILDEGANALFSRPGDPESLAEAIKVLLSDGELSRTMRKNNLAKSELFSLERLGQELERIYSECLGQPK